MKDVLSYLAFGALVMGGVPLRDLPENVHANIEVAPKVAKKKARGTKLLTWLRSSPATLDTQQPVPAH